MAGAARFILSFDTSAAHCAAAVLSGDRVLAQAHEPMARGQAERLMPLIGEVMAAGGVRLEALDAIAVGVGPGNFTGIRIAVSAARGLALALGIPAIGVTAFEAMRGPNSAADRARQLVSLPGPRDSYLLQVFEDGRAAGGPVAAPGPDGIDWDALGVTPDTDILGHGADRIAGTYPPDRGAAGPRWTRGVLPTQDLAATIGRIARDKRAQGAGIARPTPLYVRPADAAPSREAGPTMLPC